jgi:hypothetical protein
MINQDSAQDLKTLRKSDTQDLKAIRKTDLNKSTSTVRLIT